MSLTEGPPAQLVSAWGGQARAAYQATGAEESSECFVCYCDKPNATFARFKPCDHSACLECVQTLRSSAIFKADKGVACPFCRTFIDQYEPQDPSNESAKAACQAASQAALKASQERLGIVERPSHSRHQSYQDASNLGPIIGGGWTCSFDRCKQTNSLNTEVCQHCGKPRIDINTKRLAEGKDILSMTALEVKDCAMAKFHPSLLPAFADMGLEVSHGKIRSDDMTSFAMKQLAYHFFGNYLIQHAVASAAKLRDAVPLCQRKADAATLRAAQSAFGRLHRHLLGDLADMAMHQQASHVMDILVELSSPAELFAIADELSADTARLMVDARGFHLMRRVVERLCTIMLKSGPEELLEGRELLGSFCAAMSAQRGQLQQCLGSNAVVRLLVTMLEFGCNSIGTLWLAEEIAKLLPAMLSVDSKINNVGVSHACILVSVQPRHAHGPPCVFRDMVCLIAYHIKGRFAWLGEKHPHGTGLVAEILRRLAAEQEIDWVDYILQELIQGLAPRLAVLDELTSVMADMLCEPLLEDSYVQALLQMTGSLDAGAREVLFRKVSQKRVLGQPKPPVRYYAPCCIQPNLADDMAAGMWQPPPPPPPGSLTAGDASNYSSPDNDLPLDALPEPLPDAMPELPPLEDALPEPVDPMFGMLGGLTLTEGTGIFPPYQGSNGHAADANAAAPWLSGGLDAADNAASPQTSFGSMGGGLGMGSDIWSLSAADLQPLSTAPAPPLAQPRQPAAMPPARPPATAAPPSQLSHGRADGPRPPHFVAQPRPSQPPLVNKPDAVSYGGRGRGRGLAGTSAGTQVPRSAGTPAQHRQQVQQHPHQANAAPLRPPSAAHQPPPPSHGRPATRQARPPSNPPTPADLASAQPATAESWACQLCTYHHTGPESLFLSCAMCGTPKHDRS